jgi:DNA (cytosine-5)-methyltransferase 1
MAKSKAVSLFSGCGGFCEGIELAGFDIKCSVELDRFAADTYRYNFPHVPLIQDDVAAFSRSAKHQPAFDLHDIDLVFGGPPCQGYSQIVTRDVGDQSNELYQEFARVVAKVRPRVFLMENVPNLLLFKKGYYRDKIFKQFRSIGYSNVTNVVVRASDHGVPQHRDRVFFLGTRDEDNFPFDLSQFSVSILSSAKTTSPVTVWDAIGDLPARVVPSGKTLPYPKGGKYTKYQKLMRLDFSYGLYSRAAKRRRGVGGGPIVLHNHHTKEIQARRRHLISFLKPGHKADSLPKHIWNGLRPEKWRRLHPHLPAYTILAQMHRDLSEWVHPKLDRWITVREAARLQSFHDGFVFVGSEWQQLKQIGNAVPPLLGHAVGELARAILAQEVFVIQHPLTSFIVQRELPLIGSAFEAKHA